MVTALERQIAGNGNLGRELLLWKLLELLQFPVEPCRGTIAYSDWDVKYPEVVACHMEDFC